MKFNIFNVLSWLNKPVCNCKSKKDTKIVRAITINEVEALEKILKDREIKFEKSDTKESGNGYYEIKYFSYRINTNGIEFFTDATSRNEFYKDACLTCKTCLGWRHIDYTGIGHETHYPEVSRESPEEYFNNLINTAGRKINEEELAKEICGEI